MTKASLKVTAWPLIAGPVSGPRQAIGLTWEDAAPPPAIVLVDGEPQHIEWTEHHGQLRRATVFIPLPATKKIVRLTISQGAHQLEIDCAIEPPSHWELFLVPHSHVDIGYTEYQDILSDAHGDYFYSAS